MFASDNPKDGQELHSQNNQEDDQLNTQNKHDSHDSSSSEDFSTPAKKSVRLEHTDSSSEDEQQQPVAPLTPKPLTESSQPNEPKLPEKPAPVQHTLPAITETTAEKMHKKYPTKPGKYNKSKKEPLVVFKTLLDYAKEEKVKKLLETLEREVRGYARINLNQVGDKDNYTTKAANIGKTREVAPERTKVHPNRGIAVTLLLELLNTSGPSEIYEYVTTSHFQNLAGCKGINLSDKIHLASCIQSFISGYEQFLEVSNNAVLIDTLTNPAVVAKMVETPNFAKMLFEYYNPVLIADLIINHLDQVKDKFKNQAPGLFSAFNKILANDFETINSINTHRWKRRVDLSLPAGTVCPGESKADEEALDHERAYQYEDTTIFAVEKYLFENFGSVLCNNVVYSYNLALMSTLPLNNKNEIDAYKVEHYTIYLSADNKSYLVRDANGVIREGSLKNIDLSNLDKRLNDEELKKQILAITFKAGHTQQKQKMDPNAPYHFYLITTDEHQVIDPKDVKQLNSDLQKNIAEGKQPQGKTEAQLVKELRYENFSKYIKALIVSQNQNPSSKPIIFCGIINVDGVHYIPYFIHSINGRTQVFTIDPSGRTYTDEQIALNEKTKKEIELKKQTALNEQVELNELNALIKEDPKINARLKLQRIFKDIFDDSCEFKDADVTQMVRERDCGPNSATTLFDALRSCTTNQPLFQFDSSGTLNINPEALSLNFKPIAVHPQTQMFIYSGELDQTLIEN